MRLFAAVELEAPVRAAIASDECVLRAGLPHGFKARWVPEENTHITLCFLGEVDDGRVPSILAALDSPFDQRAFSVGLAGFGAFPPSGAPRVLWIGIGSGTAGLAALHDRIAVRLEPLGFPRAPRPYSAHVTIARVRDPGGSGVHAAVRRALADAHAQSGTSLVTAVTVFRSRLSPKGASYEALLRVPLNG